MVCELLLIVHRLAIVHIPMLMATLRVAIMCGTNGEYGAYDDDVLCYGVSMQPACAYSGCLP